MTDEIEPLTKLGKRAREVAHEHGIHLERFIVQPNLDNENHRVFGYFTLSDDDDTPIVKQRVKADAPDDEFKKMIDETRRADRAQKEQDAAERVRKMSERLSDPHKGLGLDDD